MRAIDKSNALLVVAGSGAAPRARTRPGVLSDRWLEGGRGLDYRSRIGTDKKLLTSGKTGKVGRPCTEIWPDEVDPRMAMNGTRSQGTGSPTAAQAAVAKENAARRMASDAPETSRPVGYGLPCAKCHLYYPADLDACPTCRHKGRVSPPAANFPARPLQTAPGPAPDSAELEREREEFLRQFKSQLIEVHAEIGDAPQPICRLGENHPGEPGVAEVCTSCYERLQQRCDVCEASLHIDLKEAAQIIYDAVWADPSDPGKTYQNAASALLTELRKRAGITALLGPCR